MTYIWVVSKDGEMKWKKVEVTPDLNKYLETKYGYIPELIYDKEYQEIERELKTPESMKEMPEEMEIEYIDYIKNGYDLSSVEDYLPKSFFETIKLESVLRRAKPEEEKIYGEKYIPEYVPLINTGTAKMDIIEYIKKKEEEAAKEEEAEAEEEEQALIPLDESKLPEFIIKNWTELLVKSTMPPTREERKLEEEGKYHKMSKEEALVRVAHDIDNTPDETLTKLYEHYNSQPYIFNMDEPIYQYIQDEMKLRGLIEGKPELPIIPGGISYDPEFEELKDIIIKILMSTPININEEQQELINNTLNDGRTEDNRKKFVNMIDSLLSNIPEDVLSTLSEKELQVIKDVGEKYSSE